VVTFLPDTSCIVAAVCSWHEHHAAAAHELGQRFGTDQPMVLAAHTLAESYAVLTRLPPPHRIAPNAALTLLEANFAERGTVVALDGRGYLPLLRTLARAGHAGGRTYDALIAQCARKGRVDELITFNPTHFAPFADDAFAIVVPGQPRR
jgi:predicted nucleic acid-binding protein